MRPLGIVLIAILLLLPIIWLPGIARGRDVIALFSQYLGMAALIAMAIAQIIATRWSGVEPVFGPLDQSYRVHKWLGIGSMVAILLHDTIDAEMDGLGRETVIVVAAETLGEISLYGLLILVIITIATFIPYHLWKWTHRLIGIFFVMGALHYLFILKPFSNGDPLGLYMGVVCVIGLVAYAYTSAPRRFRPYRTYRVERTRQEHGALAIEMVPEGRALRHRPGQFAFFSFMGAGLPEPHPVTISSAPAEDGRLRITVAPLGDLTGRVIRAVEAGGAVRVEGPYGRFGQGPARSGLWIAAGIGVTPFLALGQALAPSDPPVTMIYSVRDRSSAAHLAELEDLAAAKDNFRLELWESAARGRLTAEGATEFLNRSGDAARVMFCGPVEMRRSLAQGFAVSGVSPRDFHYEEFEIRTGLGLRPFARWLWDRRGDLAQRAG